MAHDISFALFLVTTFFNHHKCFCHHILWSPQIFPLPKFWLLTYIVTKIWVTNNPFSITIILITTIIFQSPHTIFGHQHFQLSHINQQLNFDDKKKQGVEGVLSYVLVLVKFHFFCPKSLVILLGNFFFWNGTSINLQYFCYIIILARISIPKNEKLRDMKWWDPCYLLYAFNMCI